MKIFAVHLLSFQVIPLELLNGFRCYLLLLILPFETCNPSYKWEFSVKYPISIFYCECCLEKLMTLFFFSYLSSITYLSIFCSIIIPLLCSNFLTHFTYKLYNSLHKFLHALKDFFKGKSRMGTKRIRNSRRIE